MPQQDVEMSVSTSGLTDIDTLERLLRAEQRLSRGKEGLLLLSLLFSVAHSRPGMDYSDHKSISSPCFSSTDLRDAAPWLPSAVAHPHRRRVRPIPTSMEEVEDILALARQYAARTSAPAGWNPQAPVVGFGTPAPLPNQLRAGNLAALQLERAQALQKQQAAERRKRQRQAALQQQQAAAAKPASEAAASERSETEPDPKRREINRQDKLERRHSTTIPPPRKPSVHQQTPAVMESMNLSDSSSDDEEED